MDIFGVPRPFMGADNSGMVIPAALPGQFGPELRPHFLDQQAARQPEYGFQQTLPIREMSNFLNLEGYIFREILTALQGIYGNHPYLAMQAQDMTRQRIDSTMVRFDQNAINNMTPTYQNCPTCNGAGRIGYIFRSFCRQCNGWGVVLVKGRYVYTLI